MQDDHSIFERDLWRKRRQRASAVFANVAYLKDEAAQRIIERLDDIKRDFPLVLDMGSHQGALAQLLSGRAGIQHIVQMDHCLSMLPAKGLRVQADEEWLPFAAESLDAAFSAMSLHWVNDLPGALIQLRRALKPDGLFMAILPGARTLHELRTCLADAELACEGGISPRISPFVEVRDAGGLLQRAGFALPVVDSDIVQVTYPNAWALMQELRQMGESNALRSRRRQFTRRETLLHAMELYHARHQDAEGRITASFEFITLTAWSPHISQQKPARRGSATIGLHDFFS
ncbi:MAG: methyltransferase domain-containing protein [Rickettsiales bacterium]|nr:methyltransferase domain-containing protein [Rickettsiales bacterium]